MSSDIQNRDVITLGSNQEAWWGHQAGKLFAGRLSPLRCLAEGVASFDVHEVPVTLDGMPLDDRKGLIAVQDGERWPLSVVGEGYGVLQNTQYWDILDRCYNGEAVVETAGTLGNGKRVWALIAAGEFTVQQGDKLKEFDLWVNSHDGSYSFCCIATTVRVVCQNTLTMAFGKARNRLLNVKHTVNINDLAASAVNVLQTSRTLRLAEKAKMHQMAGSPMTAKEASAFFETLLGISAEAKEKGIPTRTANALEELDRLFVSGRGNLGRSRWDALNAVTEYSDHFRTTRTSEGTSKAESRWASAFLGSGADLKARAFDLLTV